MRNEQHEIEGKNQEILRKLVDREIVHCCSNMVSQLIQISENMEPEDYETILQLCTKADYESAAWDEGWREVDDDINISGKPTYWIPCDDDSPVVETSHADNWQELCAEQNIEPHEREVFEHWIVTGWLAEKLKAHGETVGELFDFHIWGRCTTGQAILLDYVIRQIASEMEILVGQKNDWSK
jgi:hypothetical protein